MDKRIILYIAIILTAVFDSLAHVFSKKYIDSSQRKQYFILLIVLSYLALAALNIQIMKMNKFTVAYMLHTLSHVVVIGMAALIGKLYFKEKYTNKELLGLILGNTLVFPTFLPTR